MEEEEEASPRWGQKKDGGPTRDVTPRRPVPHPSRRSSSHSFLPADRLGPRHHPDAFPCFRTPKDASPCPTVCYCYSGEWFSGAAEGVHRASFKRTDSIQMNKGLFPELSQLVDTYLVFSFVLTT